MHLWLTHSHRGQAPSHIWICIHQADLGLLLPWLFVALEPTGFVSDVLGKNVGGGLPPDEGVSVGASVADPQPSGASPLPQFDLHTSGRPQLAFALLLQPWRRSCAGVLGKKCGRGLAPDGGVSVGAFVADPQPSGASRIVAPPLPHLDLRTSGRPGAELEAYLKRHYLYE